MNDRYSRQLVWVVNEQITILDYYPTQLEILLENFALKHNTLLLQGKENLVYYCSNYSRSMHRPINGFNLKYERHVWEDDENYEEVKEFIPELIGSFRDVLCEETVAFHMRSLHDPSKYTEELEIDGREINFKMDFHLNESGVWKKDEPNRDLKPEEFEFIGKYLDKKNMSLNDFYQKIKDLKPPEVFNLVFKGIENYKGP